jgi:hypothetical protein
MAVRFEDAPYVERAARSLSAISNAAHEVEAIGKRKRKAA